MSFTPEEIERRRSVVGASEVGLLFGLPSFGGRTVSDLWYEKKFGTVTSGKGNASTALGHKLEPIVLDEAEQRLGTSIVDRQLWLRNGCNAATLDGRCANNGAIVEAKTSGVLWRTDAEWGEDGSDDVPDSYLMQVQAQLLVTGAEIGWLAALIGGRGFAMFEIHPNEDLQFAIQSKSAEFIASLASDIPPEEPPTLETLKRLRRQPDKVLEYREEIELAHDILEEAKADCKKTDEAKDIAQRRLLAMLGDAEAAQVTGGYITYKPQTRKESFSPASTFRVLRFKKGSL